MSSFCENHISDFAAPGECRACDVEREETEQWQARCDTLRATIATLTAALNSASRDVALMLADVERLTKEREQLIHVDVLNSAHDRELTHLAAIETLRAFADVGGRYALLTGNLALADRARQVIADTADYAKKADEVTDGSGNV